MELYNVDVCFLFEVAPPAGPSEEPGLHTAHMNPGLHTAHGPFLTYALSLMGLQKILSLIQKIMP